MVFAPGSPRPPLLAAWQPLGRRLTAGRVAQGRSLAQLAPPLGVRANTVRCWETGHFRPRAPLLHRLAALLDIPYAELAALAGYPVAD